MKSFIYNFLFVWVCLFGFISSTNASAVVVGNSVTFRGMSVEGAEYSWKFSDGGTAEGQLVEHVFFRTGTFDVTLVVTKDGKINSVTKKVQVVQNQIPMGRISANKTAGTTDTVFWFLADYEDPERNNISYQWSINKAFSLEEEIIQDSERQSVSHSFSEAGRYKVQVSVSDGISRTEDFIYVNITPGKTTSSSLEEENMPPSVSIYSISPSSAGLPTTIFRIYPKATDPNHDPLTYSWTISDGTRYDVQNIAHRFSAPGTYSMKLVVSDGVLNTTAETNIQVFPNENALNSAQTPKIIKIVDGGGNTHAIPLDDQERNIFVETKDGDITPLEISTSTGPPPTLMVTGTDGNTQAIPLSEEPQTISLGTEGARTQVLETSLDSRALQASESSGHLPHRATTETNSSLSITDAAGNIQKIPLDGQASSVQVVDQNGTTSTIGIRGQALPTPTLTIADAQGQTYTIPISSSEIPIEIFNILGEKQVLFAQATTSPTSPSGEPLVISFLDESGETISIPVDENYHLISFKRADNTLVSVQAKGTVGPPRRVYIINPLGTVQESIIRETTIPISIPTESGSSLVLQTKTAAPHGQEANIAGASAFNPSIAKEQLQGWRTQKINQSRDSDATKELLKEAGEINEAMISLGLGKRGNIKDGDPGTVNLEVLKTQLLVAKKEQEIRLSKEPPKSTNHLHISRKLQRINVLLDIVEKDIEEQSKNNIIKIEIPKEDPVDQLEQQKAQKEAEMQRAQKEGAVERVLALQEELLSADNELEELKAALPPPSAEANIEILKKDQSKLEKEKQELDQELAPLIEQKTSLEQEKALLEERISQEVDPKKKENLIKQLENIDKEIETLNKDIEKKELQISEIDQQLKVVESEIQKEEVRIEELVDICKNPITGNPYFIRTQLLEQTEEKLAEQAQAEEEKHKKQLQSEIERLEVQANGVLIANNRSEPCLDASKINPGLLKMELTEIKTEKQARLESSSSPEEINKIRSDIEKIDEQIERLNTILETANVNLVVNTRTTVLLYAHFSGETPEALFFEWNLGDGRMINGQNARLRYDAPGVYEVVLSVSGALTSLSESITIKVNEIEE